MTLLNYYQSNAITLESMTFLAQPVRRERERGGDDADDDDMPDVSNGYVVMIDELAKLRT
jgi:hypothetical protein